MNKTARPTTRINRLANWPNLAFFCLAIVMAWILSARPPWDPDLGWHLRNGADVLRFGAPKGDLYSYTMAGYPWVSHEWLTDVWMYLVSHYFGLVALSAIFATITVTAYLIAAKVAKTSWESVGVSVIITALVAMPIVGIRPQMLTLLGLSAVLLVLFRWRDQPANRLIYWLPLIMLLWVNLHGSFAIGLFLMATFGAIELIKYLFSRYRPKLTVGRSLNLIELWQLVGVGVLSFGATFINPYTWRIYDELFRTIFNEQVRQGINEWLPVTFSNPNSYNFIIYAGFLALLLIFSWRRVDSTKIWIGGIFLLLSISSWRNIPLFPLVTLPLLAEAIEVLSPKGVAYYLRSGWVLILTLALTGYIGYRQYILIVPLSLSEPAMATMQGYPYDAVQYLKQNQPPGNLFNEYNWGGYLIWKLPEYKVFIDGRMAVWQTKTQNVFGDYLAISKGGEEALKLLDKYDIDTALIYTDRKLAPYLSSLPSDWQLVYQDKIATIFIRVSGTDLISALTN